MRLLAIEPLPDYPPHLVRVELHYLGVEGWARFDLNKEHWLQGGGFEHWLQWAASDDGVIYTHEKLVRTGRRVSAIVRACGPSWKAPIQQKAPHEAGLQQG
jgi:hypothetical protein